MFVFIKQKKQSYICISIIYILIKKQKTTYLEGTQNRKKKKNYIQYVK